MKERERPAAIALDADPRNADWAKFHWSLPPYKSPDFMSWLDSAGMTLEQFRSLPIYELAVEQRRIVNDTWVESHTGRRQGETDVEPR